MADDGSLFEGVDYAFPPRPSIAQLAAAKKQFACRYGGPGSIDKQLDPDEAQALSAAGISIVANAEGAAGGLAGGYSTGASWARSAEARFAACGMPKDRPIYFSVDFDVQSGQWAAVASALRGAADVLGGVHRVGVYGGRRAIQWARRDGVAAWFWQTYAWSGGIWEPGNHIEQYHNGVQLAGADVDLNRALVSDFGQWTTGADDMNIDQDAKLTALYQAYFFGGASCGDSRKPDNGHAESNSAVNKLDHIGERIETLPAAQVDVAALAAALAPMLDAAAERALRRVMLDAGTPDGVAGS